MAVERQRRRSDTLAGGPRRGVPFLSAVALVTAALAVAIPAAALDELSYSSDGCPLDPKVLPQPAGLEPAIGFWTDVFAEVTSRQAVIHDDLHLDVVYRIVDMNDIEQSSSSAGRKARDRRRRVDAALNETRLALRRLGGDRSVRVQDDVLERVRRAWDGKGSPSGGFRGAARRVRSQTGLRDRFAEAIEISGMFMPGIRRAMARHGVPEAVTCLPFVESMFNYKARSKVGASGAWQFTRSTGRLFLQIDAAVDGRSDVLLAADGAARYLRQGYESIGAWPLALTGYNHGMGGMRNASRRLGTKDIDTVVKKYRSRTFGFASRNFYAEFIAAARVFTDRQRYFPGVEQRPELRFDELRTDRYVSLLDLANLTQIAEGQLIELNPALARTVHQGTLLVPPGYPLRVPEGTRATFVTAYDRIPADRKRTRQLATRHTVRRGDTVGRIAARYGSSVNAIAQANNLRRVDQISIGQVLEVPTQGGGSGTWSRRVDLRARLAQEAARAEEQARVAAAGGTAPAAPSDFEGRTHKVRSGESLSRIAESYGVGLSVVAEVNGIRRPDQIRVGQVLRIPARGTRMHTVSSGETLGTIASRFGTSVSAIQQANDLSGSLIQPGQRLRIPPRGGG